jgi:hypothetical protein
VLSLEGRELESESGVLDSNGLVTARQEPNESEDRQEKSWHVPIVPPHSVLSQSFTRGRNNGEGQVNFGRFVADR